LPPSHVFADSELFRYERAAFREATAVMKRMRLPSSRSRPAGTELAARDEPAALLAQMLLEPRLGGHAVTRCRRCGGPQPGRADRASFLNGAVSMRAAATMSNAGQLGALGDPEKSTKLPSDWERYRRNPTAEALLRTP